MLSSHLNHTTACLWTAVLYKKPPKKPKNQKEKTIYSKQKGLFQWSCEIIMIKTLMCNRQTAEAFFRPSYLLCVPDKPQLSPERDCNVKNKDRGNVSGVSFYRCNTHSASLYSNFKPELQRCGDAWNSPRHPNDLVCALKHRIRFDLTLLKQICNLRINTDSVITFILPPFSSMRSAVISDKNVSVTVSKSRLGATPPPPLLLLLLTVYCNSLASSSRCSVTGLIQQWDSIQIILADSPHNVSVPQLFFSFPWNPFPWCMCSPNSSWCHSAKQWRGGS